MSGWRGSKLSLQGVFNERANQAEFFDHFMDADCLSRWNTLESDANSEVQLQTSGRGGVVNIICDTDINGEAYLYSNNTFKWNGLLPMMFQARMVGDNDTTDNAYAWAAGIWGGSVWGSGDAIADGGLDVGYATGDMAIFFKPTGTNLISLKCSTSASTYVTYETQSKQESDPAGGQVPFIGLQIQVIPQSEEQYSVVFFVDEGGGMGFQPCMDLHTHKPIKHNMFYDPATAMAVGAGLKTTKAEESLLRIDYMGGVEHALRYPGRE